MHGPPDPLGLADLRRRLPRRERIPRPTRRQVAALLVVALAVATVWVRLADPVALAGGPPAVDPGDPPAEVVADAVARLEYVDYTYRITPGRGTGQVTKVDNTHQELFTAVGDVRKRYAAEDGYWVKLRGERWRTIETREFDRETAAPFRPGPLRDADVTVLRETDGTLVVAVTGAATVAAVLGRDAGGGRLQFAVDLEAGRLERVRLRRAAAGTSGWWEYTFYDYGTTTVRRPPGVPGRSPGDYLRDVLEG